LPLSPNDSRCLLHLSSTIYCSFFVLFSLPFPAAGPPFLQNLPSSHGACGRTGALVSFERARGRDEGKTSRARVHPTACVPSF